MTTADIDAHPDADRIWATIAAIQGAVDTARDEGEEAASDAYAGKVDQAEEEAWEECRNRIDGDVDAILAKDGIPAWLAADLEKLKEALS